MRLWELRRVLPGVLALVAATLGVACQQSQQPVTNTNTTTTTASVNSNAPANVTVTTQTTTTGNVIETREPDRYSATMTITAAASGQQTQQVPPFTIDVARSGADRYYSMNLPAPLGRIAFLDKSDKRYVILHGSRQYAELTPEVTGVEVPRSLTPGQIIAQIERQQGVERVGEETLNNRPAIKYRHRGTTNTGTQAGQVTTESFIYVDRETGLPLRIEGFGQSSGSAQGVNSGRAVIEMTNLKTEVDTAQFELPQGYTRITPEQLRQQAQQVAGLLQGLMSLMNMQQSGGGAGTATPAAPPAPAATR
jgi:hypothetical protein